MENENFIIVDHINGYLMPNSPDIYVMKRATPFFNVPEMSYGNFPIDNGNLLLTLDERGNLIKKILLPPSGFVRLLVEENLLTEFLAIASGLKVVRPMSLEKCHSSMNALKMSVNIVYKVRKPKLVKKQIRRRFLLKDDSRRRITFLFRKLAPVAADLFRLAICHPNLLPLKV